MYYFAIRLCLTLLVETFIMRMSAHLLTMRSNKQYYLAALTYFFIWAPLKELPLPNSVRVLALLISICIPIACSVGPLHVRLSREMPQGRRAIENQLWVDIQAKYKDYAGGHLYAYDPAKSDGAVYLEGTAAPLVDLGIPVPSNSIYAMAMDATGQKIYGLSYPDAEFFSHDIAAGKTVRHGKWMEKLSYPGPERSWRGVPRALSVAADGKVWSSGDDGLLRYFDPETGKFGGSEMRVPGEYWETQAYNAFPVVEQLFVQTDGSLIGTSSEETIVDEDDEAK